jgi:glycosyltransferase involved in cell wall biosynthesis
MTRYLRELGYSVTIVASDAWGRLPDDAASGVVRVSDLRAVRPLRGLFRRGQLRLEGDSTLERPPTALLTKVLVPEMNVVTWLPAEVVAVRRLLVRETFDCLITTSPPESAHLIGLLLGGHRPAWVADFRDGWTFEPWREPFPTAAQRSLDAWLERRVVERADVAVGATRPIADDLERRLGARAAWVPNGWDPASAQATGPGVAASSRSDAVTLVYTGTLSGAWGRDPEPLLRALQMVRAKPGAEPLRLVHAGRLTTDERALIARTGVADLVEHLGTLDRAGAIALQRSADALVLLTSRHASEATSKVFEYLAAGRPIIALAEGNEAAHIIRETNTGITVPPDDVAAIAEALRRVVSGELARAYAPRRVERFIYPAPAEAMAELVEQAIRQRSIGSATER